MFSKKKPKIFCVSTQRTGTTSVGEFFRRFKYAHADWNIANENQWSYLWDQGNFEAIFNSKAFKENQVFEDDPWWLPEFYKVLYHRFPDAKFILFTRDSDEWFNSMLKHSDGKTLGNGKRHCKVYRREQDFYDAVKGDDLLNYDEHAIDNLLSLEGQREHYKQVYELRNQEIINFFAKTSPQSLLHCSLKDPDKWKKVGEFVGVKVPDGFEMHTNKSSDIKR